MMVGASIVPREEEEDVISESLLAMAKDSRYVLSCHQLVHHVLTAFLGEDAGSETASLLSTIFYSLVVLWKRKKTFGMESLDLEFNNNIPNVHRKVAIMSLTVALARWLNKRYRRRRYNITAETLRGNNRREYYQAQRRAMMERARLLQEKEAAQREENQSKPGGGGIKMIRRQMAQQKSAFRQATQKLLSDIKALMLNGINVFISVLTSNPLEDPHQVHSDDSQGDPQESSLPCALVSNWILRLHLAFYCLNGQYASWTHRVISSLPMYKSMHNENNSSALVHRPTTNRVVGLLILAHALGKLVQVAIRTVVEKWIDSQDSRPTLSQGSRNCLSSIDFGFTNAVSNGIHDDSVTTCGICHRPRHYPACPASCGHVFCWTCLQQWAVTVRPECPLCRSPCDASSIVALYNYSPGES